MGRPREAAPTQDERESPYTLRFSKCDLYIVILGAGLFRSPNAQTCRKHSYRTRCCTQAANACHAAVFPIGTRVCSTNMRKEPAHSVARWTRRVDHRS